MSTIASMFDVSGRVGVVTGGGTGIGYMIAESLVANGMKGNTTNLVPHSDVLTEETSLRGRP